jgi:predicted amidohydrolase
VTLKGFNVFHQAKTINPLISCLVFDSVSRMTGSSTIRVALSQIQMRPVESFKEFERGLLTHVEAAALNDAQLIVLPEYFSAPLLGLEDSRLGTFDRLSRLGSRFGDFEALFGGLAKKHGITIVAGSSPRLEGGKVFNTSAVCTPTGRSWRQDKIMLTPFERQWDLSSGTELNVFSSNDLGRFAVAICYDVEFSEIVRPAGLKGLDFLVVPSCTEDQSGHYRVRLCAQARAIENQCYVLHCPSQGYLPGVREATYHTGTAAIYTPCDAGFAQGGIACIGDQQHEGMLFGQLNRSLIAQTKTHGAVRTHFDSQSIANSQIAVKVIEL